MAGGRVIATGTRTSGERVEIRTPHARVGLGLGGRVSGEASVSAEMRAMDIQLHDLTPFERDSVISAPEGGIGHVALDGMDILRED